MGTSYIRPLSVGEILDGAFSIYKRNFSTLIGGVFVFLGPLLILYLLNFWLGAISSMFLNAGAMATGIWMASELAMGRSTQVGAAAKVGAGRMIPLLICMLFFMIVLTLGCMCLIVPGIFMYIVWFAWAPLIVLEDEWNFFRRSAVLAKDSWGKIALVMLVSTIIVGLPGMIIGAGSFLFGDQPSPTTGLSFDDYVQPYWMSAANILVTALTLPFSSTVVTLLYYDMRVRKEGLDVELSAAGMDAAVDSAGPVDGETHE